MSSRAQILAELREKVGRIEGAKARLQSALAFDVAGIDWHLPGGGLAYGAIHEVAGGGSDVVNGVAPALFVAGIAARTKGRFIWCLHRNDLDAPALAQVGLDPNRVIYVEGDDEAAVMSSFEEALRWKGLAAVVAEMVRLPMTESRRFQLAAETSDKLGLIIRRWRCQTEATVYGNPTAATTRWRVSLLPSAPLPVPGVGRSRWLLELMRARGCDSREWLVAACDAEGKMELPNAGFDDDSLHRNVGISHR